jgi:predicted HicB family RNase H-like nuclease
MKISKSRIISLSALLFFVYPQMGCDDGDDTVSPVESFEISDSFDGGTDNWSGDFADYDVGEEEFFELEFERTGLPDPLDADQKALKLSGANHSDDLFMFLKKKVSGLEPNARYGASFSVRFASKVADGLAGIGGSPGESVFVKVGASAIEPEKVIETDPREIYRMNVDKGVQSNGGDDAVVVGDFSNDTDESVYTLKTVENDSPFEATTNENGELWLLIGTDSGFEGTTTIYYDQISVKLALDDAAMPN